MTDTINKPETESQVGKDRLERWQQKLLDLSLRNRLLNVRDNQFVIPLICEDITKLEDTLASNGSLKQYNQFKSLADNTTFSSLYQGTGQTTAVRRNRLKLYWEIKNDRILLRKRGPSWWTRYPPYSNFDIIKLLY